MRVAVAPPGSNTFAVTPVELNELASAATNASSEALVIPYATWPESNTVSRPVPMKMILLHPRSIIPGTASREGHGDLLVLTSDVFMSNIKHHAYDT